MAIVPIRNLGQLGVNTDVDPLDLPITAFSYAANVRFTDNKISRGPVFSVVGETTSDAKPRWAYSYRLQGASATYLVCSENGTVSSVQASTPGSPLTYTDLSVAAYTPSAQTFPFTTCMLANVVYVNRQDRVPWSMAPGASQFSTLAGGFDSTWRCKSLRAFNGALVAINVTKGAIDYPTMIKTSDFAAFGSIPGSWTASLSNSATENVITDLTEALIDGWPLRDRFMLYSNNETWQMTPTGDAFIYRYDRLFSNYGVIAQNCVAEVNNLHFVFGDNDIWMHDGFNPKSLANGRVRKFIFDNLVRADAERCFVVSNPKLNEVMFCYPSEDPYAAFPYVASYGCNKAAVYNWNYDTWTFYDLPYVSGGGLGAMFTGLTYADLGSSYYDSMSGTFMGLSDTSRLFNLWVGRQVTVTVPVLPFQTTGSNTASATHMYAFETLEDIVGFGTATSLPNAPSFLENVQLDMDEVSKELAGYKIVTAMYPEGRVPDTSNPLTFWWAGVDYSGDSVNWSAVDSQTYDGSSNYKLDFRNPGRYLSMRMAVGNPAQRFSLSGFDLEYKVIGHR